jgi:hypothetical protein
MELEQHAPLLAADNATFSGLVVEVLGGWRASGVLQLQPAGEALKQQIVGPLTFPSKPAAQQWLQKVGKDHGFPSVYVAVRRLSEAEKRTGVDPSKGERAGTFWEP